MEVTIVGLQNAGKTSLLRVLAVSFSEASASALREGVMRLKENRG
jgi:ABC-type phosphate/phosphonate transport system ATPase subunit